MEHPLSRFAPSPSLASLRESGGGRPQRGGAALARGHWPWPRQFHALRVQPVADDGQHRSQAMSHRVGDFLAHQDDVRVAGEFFVEAFADTQREFDRIFPRLFPGGEGKLVLTDPKNMLETGIEVEAAPKLPVVIDFSVENNSKLIPGHGLFPHFRKFQYG